MWQSVGFLNTPVLPKADHGLLKKLLVVAPRKSALLGFCLYSLTRARGASGPASGAIDSLRLTRKPSVSVRVESEPEHL